jgi:hypothetical protein
VLLKTLNSLSFQLHEPDDFSILIPLLVIFLFNLLKHSFRVDQLLPLQDTILDLPLHISNLISDPKPLLPQILQLSLGLLTPLRNLPSVFPKHLQLEIIRLAFRPSI